MGRKKHKRVEDLPVPETPPTPVSDETETIVDESDDGSTEEAENELGIGSDD